MGYRVLFFGLAATVWIVINLPASLVRHMVDPSAATLVAPTGTIWHGSSQLVSPLGMRAEIQWETTFLRPGANFVLSHENSLIEGRFEPGINHHRVTVVGQLDTATLAPLLARYDLFVPGTFEL